MGAGKIQLNAKGPTEFHLIGNPQITYFKKVFKRHTNFAKETRRIFFSGEERATFGSKNLKAEIKNEGDLIGKIFLDVVITGTTASETYTVSNFANSLIEQVVLDIGGFKIDTIYGRFNQILEELKGNVSHQNQQISDTTYGGMYANIDRTNDNSQSLEIISPKMKTTGNYSLTFGGSHNGISVSPGTFSKRLNIPLNFWFNKSEGMYLPLSALFRHKVSLFFDFASEASVKGDNAITNFTMTPKLYGEYVILDDEEKKRFAQSNHEYIIEQHQLNNNAKEIVTTVVDNAQQLGSMNIELNFNNPIKFFTWVIVNEGTQGSNKGVGPCYFTSLTESSLYGNDAQSGVVEILLEGVTREIEMPMSFYTRIHPCNILGVVPTLDRIGFYSFAIDPLNAEPTGTCNFSKLYDKNIKISFANNNANLLAGKDLYIYAINYNILTITGGMAQVRYT